MHPRFHPLRLLSQLIQRNFKFQFTTQPVTYPSYQPVSGKLLPFLVSVRDYQREKDLNFAVYDDHKYQKPDRGLDESSIDSDALTFQNFLKFQDNKPKDEIEGELDQSGLSLNDDLVLDVLRRHRSNWKPAYIFFNWVSRGRNGNGYFPGSDVYNEILDILGRMKRFQELTQVFDEMRKRDIVNERTYGIVLHRYAAAHKVEAATELFYKRKELGLELDLVAFQTLLMCLCRYKHVEAAEFLFHYKQNEFPLEIKTMNIILNGWCVLGSLREAKRFWKDIVASGKCKPDRFTYGTLINSLTKAGKATTALKLFRAMGEKGCDPDVTICNCIIDGLCFKKRIPEALAIFQEMNGRECSPNVATYNSLIKHLCKIRRMEKVYELLDEMEQKGGSCLPNARTYGFLLKSAKNAEEVPEILQRMERVGSKSTGDTYNLLLRLFMDWDHQERVRSTWVEMERDGLGPDRRSYTIMIHGLYDKGRMGEAMRYFKEMTTKGMVPEPRTMILVNAMNIKLKEREGEARDIEAKNRDRRLKVPYRAARSKHGKER
ncbi:hypothetical protein Vadar_005291 [Vaccinium darrowii]|uniref:Uncharacterized protein n=1 Tax=Vaccinium darrowii TaxID=229202 RepID=A0ACB7Z3B6_9ERIC|nr:hypothetical protein Vadar_005291 [Vaccinium darrowii]